MTAAKRKEMMKKRRKRRRGQLNALLMLLWECFRWTPVAIGDNRGLYEGPLIFPLYHYCRVGGPPKECCIAATARQQQHQY